MPTEIDNGLIEFSNGVRLHDAAMRKLGRIYSYRRIAEIIGVSYIEYNEARAMCQGEEFDPEEDLGVPPHDPEIDPEHSGNDTKPGYRPADK